LSLYKLIAVALVAIVAVSCTSVQSKKLDKKTFILTQDSNEAPMSLSTRNLQNKAWEVCPIGFDVLTKNAYKKGSLGREHLQCVSGKHCDFVIEWKVVCTIKPKEEYSIFGPQ